MTYFNHPPQLCPILSTLFLPKRELAPQRPLGQGLPVHTFSNTSQQLCSKWLHQQLCCSTKVPPHLRQWKPRASTTVKPTDVTQPHIYVNTQVKMGLLNNKPASWFCFSAFPQYQREKLEKWTWCKKQRAETGVLPSRQLHITTSQVHDMSLPQIQNPRWSRCRHNHPELCP